MFISVCCLLLEKACGLQGGYRYVTIIYIVEEETLKMSKDIYKMTGALKGFDVPGWKG
jgi:hypothetical protein